MSALLIICYFSTLGLLSALGLHRLGLVVASFRRDPKEAAEGSTPGPDVTDLPRVLVQLPIYNEALVVERVIHAVGAFRYPRERLRIQVLDDSTDATSALVNRAAQVLRTQGISIDVVRRPERTGFKAGALQAGLQQSDEELVAIFDADFVPPEDFLLRVVPRLMADSGLGLVQTRWGHLNRNQSWLTRAQAVLLDGHFGVEHLARARSGHPFNFNGTAGVWRRQAIEDAGGWSGDTITEDFDLSYRSQMVGWRFAYAHEVVSPAELPESWTAFRAQQARWVRGSIETARKLLGPILRCERWGWRVRGAAAVHLLNNVAYLITAALALLLPATLWVREELGWKVPGGRTLLSYLDATMLTAGTLAVVVFYLVSLARCRPGELRRRMPDVAAALVLGAGMSLSNAREVVRGLLSTRSEFVRTPKSGGSSGPVKAPSAGYRASGHWAIAWPEFLAAAYHFAALAYAVRWSVWGAVPFLTMYALGFGAVGTMLGFEALERRFRASPFSERVQADDLGLTSGG